MKVEERLCNPLKLGYDLEKWAETSSDRTVNLTVLRPPGPNAKIGKRVTFDMQWDPKLVFNGESVIGLASPMPISGLGLAYYVETTIDLVDPGSPLATVLARGDIIAEIRYRETNEKGVVEPSKWQPLKHHHGAYLHSLLQRLSTADIDLKVNRGGTETEYTVSFVPDDKTPWPAIERGIVLPYDSRIQKADGLIDALDMGMHRTWRTVR